MRFKLTLQIEPEVMGIALPINYQYPLQSVIYRVLSHSDMDFSTWLHDNGYQQNNKRFKLFTYSNLIVPKFGIDKENERLIVNSDYVVLYISFLPELGTQKFIQGLFQEQVIQIADYMSGVQFVVREVQMMPSLVYHEDMTFTTLSPVCVSARNEVTNKIDYLSPLDSRYSQALLAGLLSRYEAINGKPYSGELYCHFELLSKPRSALVRIKAGTPNETRVRGYRFSFRLSVPQPLMTIAYESGLGEKGSMGFGMIEEKLLVKK